MMKKYLFQIILSITIILSISPFVHASETENVTNGINIVDYTKSLSQEQLNSLDLELTHINTLDKKYTFSIIIVPSKESNINYKFNTYTTKSSIVLKYYKDSSTVDYLISPALNKNIDFFWVEYEIDTVDQIKEKNKHVFLKMKSSLSILNNKSSPDKIYKTFSNVIYESQKINVTIKINTIKVILNVLITIAAVVLMMVVTNCCITFFDCYYF